MLTTMVDMGETNSASLLTSGIGQCLVSLISKLKLKCYIGSPNNTINIQTNHIALTQTTAVMEAGNGK